MLWLFIIISAYFLFAIVALVDKGLLVGPPNPKSYVFYVGILGILVLVLAPFVGFSIPNPSQILLSFLAGATFIFALFWLFTGLKYFEASRIVPAMGGILPLSTFGLVYLFSGGKEVLGIGEIFAFILLISGSILVTLEKRKKISQKSFLIPKSFLISALSGFFFALCFVLTKYVYLSQPFWSGFIWIRIGGFLTALGFILTKEVRREIFLKKFTFQRKTGIIFLSNQGLAAGASVLQNFAIALAGLAYLPFINALQGIQYVFLFLLVIFLAKKFPQILEEKLTKKIIFQKVVSIGLIVLGLIIFYL